MPHKPRDAKKTEEESYIPFPCEFPIKVMGYATVEFEAEVISIVRSHLPKNDTMKFNTRQSRQGNYTSITVKIIAQSKAQLDAIYQDLTANEKVLVAL